MARNALQNGVETWTIESSDGSTSATVAPELGGVVSSLIVPVAGEPRELLFQHDHFWDRDATETRGGLPILFPICGRLMLDGEPGLWRTVGRDHHLPLHGFAMRRPWVVLDDRCPDEVVLGMVDGEDTLPDYPYHFEVVLRFVVAPGRFTVRAQCTHRGDGTMPYSLGFHPYFSTPPPPAKSAVRVWLSARKRLRYDASYTALEDEASLPADGISPDDPLFSSSINLLDPPGSMEVGWPDGSRLRLLARGETDATMFPYVQLYTQPDEPFVCVEPWSAAPNALNTGNDLRRLSGGATEHAAFTIELA